MVQKTETALSHLRVLELGGRPAAYTGHFLADLGADVIKVEPPGGDPARWDPPFAGDIVSPDRSLSFLHFNANKRSIVLDLDAAQDRQTFLDLAATADIIVEAYPPGYLDQRGLGYDSLRAANPGVVLLSITPFGQTGPFRDYKGNNAIAEAMSGFIYPLSAKPWPPIISPNEFLSQTAGALSAFFAVSSIHRRRHTGRGEYIDISLQEIGTHMSTGLAEYGLHRVLRPRPKAGPGPMFKARDDKYVSTHAAQPHMMEALQAWMQDPEVSQKEWQDIEYRTRNQEFFHHKEADFISRFTAEDFVQEAQQRGIPTGPVNRVEDFLAHPQVNALGAVIEQTHPVLGTYQAIGYPFRMSETPPQFYRPAPRLDEHRKELLAALHPTSHQPVETSANGTFPLEGLRVLDFTRVIVGPVATQFLASLGADVIKVESAELRGVGRGSNAGFPDLNRGKKSITLDTRTPEGRDLALQLVAHCDVVVDNFRTGVMERLGLDYEALRSANPNIIAVSISGWGREGPSSRWSGWASTFQAFTGLLWMWRHPDAPLEAGIKSPPADYICGAEEVFAIAAALEYRNRTGKGQFIDLAMLQGTGHTLGPIYLDSLINKRDPQPQGYENPQYAPYGCYPCRGDDAWCVITVETEDEWHAFQKAIGGPDWVFDERFTTVEGRVHHREELDTNIATWTQGFTPRQVMHLLQRTGVPAGMVQNAEDLFYDYHLRSRGHIAPVHHPEPWGTFEQQGVPGLFAEMLTDGQRPASRMGQHNEDVFGKLLGLSAEEVHRLQEAKVIH